MDTTDNVPMEHKDRNEDIKNELAKNADDLGVNENVSGEDRSELGREERRHHEHHGNRRYQAFKNHSSADDQPRTDTGA